MQKLTRNLVHLLHFFLLARITNSVGAISVLCGRFTAEDKVTYCLGITTREGLVLASDSRTNAGFDQVNVCRKMYRFVQPGERVFVILTSGSLSISQSVITLLGDDFDSGRGLAQASSLYDAAHSWRLRAQDLRY